MMFPFRVQEMTEVPRIGPPSREEFEERFVRTGQPVVISGALEDWPARKKWSAEFIRDTFGDREIPVGQTRDKRLVRDGRSGIAFDTMRVGDFINRVLEGQPPDRYPMVLLNQHLSELTEDLRAPAFAPHAPWWLWKLWLSPGDNRSPLHHDLPDNLFAQFVGTKRVTLFRPSWGRHMYRYPLHSKLPQVSQVDAEEPDFKRFPLFRQARPLQVMVGPGDLLYIPRLWWHQVRSLEFSISVNYWWATGLLYGVVWSALTYQRLRSLRY